MKALNNTEKISLRHAQIFSSVTGIKIKYIPAADSKQKSPCMCCGLSDCSETDHRDCDALNPTLFSAANAALGLIQLCSVGLAYIFVPVCDATKTIGVLISEPIVCHTDAKPSQQGKHNGLTPTCSAALLSKAAALLANLPHPLHTPEGAFSSLLSAFLTAAQDKDEDNAKQLLDEAVAVLMTATGDCFFSVQTGIIRLIFLLYECMENEDTLAARQLPFETLLPRLAAAKTIGELKSCLNAAADECMRVVFYKETLKHGVLLKDALALIHQNYCSPLTLTEAAGCAFVSPSYFSRIFKESTGYTFNGYIHHLRIEKAKELLTTTDMSLKQISLTVGYHSRSYFGKMFHRLTNITPAQYRSARK